MAKNTEIRWNRILAEGTAIVVSILLAFWIQAWWDGKQQRLEEKVVLSHLLEQLREMQALRDGRERYLTAILDACRKLLDIARNADTSVTDREIDFLLNDTTYVGGSNSVEVIALESLFQGGNISKIEDTRITQQIADLRFALEMEGTYAQREVSHLDSRYYPFLDAHGSVAQIYGAEDGTPGFSKAENEQWDQYPIGSEVITESKFSHRDLLSNREFQNLLVQRTFRLNSLIGWDRTLYDVDKALRDSIELIEERL